MRENEIRLSDDEKSDLDNVAEQRFGTTEVPYGAIVSALTNDYLNGDN